METRHTETVVEKAVAYVKDMFGIQPDDQTPEVAGKPEYTDTAPGPASRPLDPGTFRRVGGHRVESARREDGVASDEAMGLDPHAYTFNKIVERSQRTSIDTGPEENAADAHLDAAEQINRARGLVGQALGEIDDVSRGMKETMHDGKKLPPESEMQQAAERAKATDSTLIP